MDRGRTASSSWISAHEQILTEPPPHAAGARTVRLWAAAVALVFGLVFGLVLPEIVGRPKPAWPWVAGAAFLLVALTIPRALAPAHARWNRAGAVLAGWNTTALLAIVYWGAVVPAGLFMRYILRRDPLERRFEPERPSYRKPSRVRTRESMENPY